MMNSASDLNENLKVDKNDNLIRFNLKSNNEIEKSTETNFELNSVKNKENENLCELHLNENNNAKLNDLNNELLMVKNNFSSTRSATPINGEFKRLHRVVFTGGPCAGKTTAINRIRQFFENIGWKVLTVPETATFLLSSGIFFYDLNETSKINFQENLLKTLIQVEDTINETAKYYHDEKNQNCIIIYDRGAMDPVSYCSSEGWEILKARNPSWNEVDLRDNRYDQIIHLVTAANGAEKYYTLENNVTRTESIEVAREIDEKCSKAWLGHPCMDCIDNCTAFEIKVARALQAVCERVGLHLKGFDIGNKKRKFLLKSLPDDSVLPSFQELNVVHNYLVSSLSDSQARVRKSGQSGVWSYSYAIRSYENNQMVETRTQIDRREYAILSKTFDQNHWTIYQKRRCFIWRNRYYRLDIYEEPCNPSCRGLILLSTRSMEKGFLLPDFLKIEKEVTNDEKYSMFNLSKKI